MILINFWAPGAPGVAKVFPSIVLDRGGHYRLFQSIDMELFRSDKLRHAKCEIPSMEIEIDSCHMGAPKITYRFGGVHAREEN